MKGWVLIMEKILEVRSLRKEYENFKLNNISFAVEAGSIVGFIGTNGSGKSTTIKSILGLIQSEYDDIRYFNMPFKQNEKEIKRRLGVVLDEGYFYETLTIEQMKSVVSPVYDNWEEKIFLKLIKEFGLNLKQKINTLSKGMKMKFSIALALAHHAELIIMDEPTSGLDPLIRNDLVLLLKEIVDKEKCSILFSTHIISDLDKVADKIILIDKGNIILADEKKVLIEEYKTILGKDNVGVEEIMLYNVKGGLV